jgi:hypothetical protein
VGLQITLKMSKCNAHWSIQNSSVESSSQSSVELHVLITTPSLQLQVMRLAVARQWPLQQRKFWLHCSPSGRPQSPPRPPTQVPLLEQSPLQHCVSLLQCLPLRLQPGRSAAASPMPATDASVPPRRAAPNNLRALRRDTLPLASALARSVEGAVGNFLTHLLTPFPEGRDYGE